MYFSWKVERSQTGARDGEGVNLIEKFCFVPSINAILPRWYLLLLLPSSSLGIGWLTLHIALPGDSTAGDAAGMTFFFRGPPRLLGR